MQLRKDHTLLACKPCLRASLGDLRYLTKPCPEYTRVTVSDRHKYKEETIVNQLLMDLVTV